MSAEEVDKVIRRTQVELGLLAVAHAAGTVQLLVSGLSDADRFSISLSLALGAATTCLGVATFGLGKRNPIGYIFAMICNVYLLFGFPITTIMAIGNLNNLSKPEFMQALGIGKVK